MTVPLEENQLAAMHKEWADSDAHLYESYHYGHERAAFYAGAAAERERLYAELGNDHYVIFTEDGWTVEHSVECRLSGEMATNCRYWNALKLITATEERDPEMFGRWRIDEIDSEGLPALVRSEGGAA